MSITPEKKIKLALFDVDETLLSFNSMDDFIAFFYMEYYGAEAGRDHLMKYETFISMVARQCRREVWNRFYYLYFSGIDRETLAEIGEKWFEARVLNQPDAFNQKVLNQLYQHKADGYQVILVSGGFFAPLNPLLKFLKIESLLCVSPKEGLKGVLTGDLDGIQTVGRGKVEAIKCFLDENIVDWFESYAYADHTSDLPMLTLVGHPVIVGDSPDLQALTRENNWQSISSSH